MGVADRDWYQEERERPRTYRGKLAGLRWEAERCPDAQPQDMIKTSAAGLGLGLLSSFALGLSPRLKLLTTLAGGALGALASRYHLNVDWDPDAVREGAPETPETPETPESTESPEPPEPTPAPQEPEPLPETDVQPL